MPYSYSYRKRHLWLSLLAVVLSIFIVYAQQQGWLSNSGAVIEKSQPGLYSVDHFVDGDTIAVNMNGHVEKVRFIGVDTPETHKPNAPVQCYGPNAATYTKTRIGNQKVRLESDSLSTNRDRYNRLLRYVYLTDGTNLNEAIIQNGYGFYYPYFPFTKSVQFSKDEQSAIASKKGLWESCKPIPTDKGGYKSNDLGT